MIKVRIVVTLKTGVLDPQGQAAEHALDALGFQVASVRQGKVFDVVFDENPTDDALNAMCEKLFANTVIENYSFERLS